MNTHDFKLVDFHIKNNMDKDKVKSLKVIKADIKNGLSWDDSLVLLKLKGVDMRDLNRDALQIRKDAIEALNDIFG